MWSMLCFLLIKTVSVVCVSYQQHFLLQTYIHGLQFRQFIKIPY